MQFSNLLNLGMLRTFCAVAEYSSLTRAAARLARSQPALTLALTKLERLVGIRLIERSRSGAQLTAAGEILHARALRMFDQLAEALNQRPSAARRLPHTLPGNLTDSQLRLIVSIADHPDIDSAARYLSITPASLRRTASSLEQSLGEVLFDAGSGSTVTNRAGAELARKTRLAVAEIEAALDEIAIAEGRVESRISLGMVPLCATQILTMAINEFLKVYPRASINIVHGPYQPLLQDLRFGRVDILYGVLRRPAWASDVTEEALFYDEYAIAVRRGHPLCGVRDPSITDLASYDWIAPPKGTPRRESIDRIFSRSDSKPVVNIQTSSLNMQRALLMASDRITLLTAQEMEQEVTIGALQKLHFKPAVTRRDDGIATRTGWKPTFVQQRFMEILRDKSPGI